MRYPAESPLTIANNRKGIQSETAYTLPMAIGLIQAAQIDKTRTEKVMNTGVIVVFILYDDNCVTVQ